MIILIYNKTKNEHLDHLRKVFLTLGVDKLYARLKKYSFMQNQVLFLGFIVSAQEISLDLDKVKVIRVWSESKTLTETRNSHGLISFYRRFIEGFSTITIPIIECLKLGTFKWTHVVHKAYLDINQKMTEASC